MEEKVVRFNFGWKVIPVPPGLTAWVVWSNGHIAPGPLPVLAMAVDVPTGSIEETGRDETIEFNGRNFRRMTWRSRVTSDAEDKLNDDMNLHYSNLHLLVAMDWSEDEEPYDGEGAPWLRLHESVFFTRARAEHESAIRKAKAKDEPNG